MDEVFYIGDDKCRRCSGRRQRARSSSPAKLRLLHDHPRSAPTFIVADVEHFIHARRETLSASNVSQSSSINPNTISVNFGMQRAVTLANKDRQGWAIIFGRHFDVRRVSSNSRIFPQ